MQIKQDETKEGGCYSQMKIQKKKILEKATNMMIDTGDRA